MNLFILRHAIAEDPSEWHGRDSDRPLTPEGLRKMRKAARGMKSLELSFDWILTSPFRRAYDTAQIVAETLKARKKLKIVKDLAVGGNLERLMKHLALDYLSGDSILLVGHEPSLSQLVSILIGAERRIGLDFKKGGLCHLSADSLQYGRCASLEAWLPPKLLRKF